MNGKEVSDSEMLYVYDAKDCNPNGDPDNENQPRFDPVGKRCIVTDVRLKRYIRDHLQAHVVKTDDEMGPHLWIPSGSSNLSTSKQRLKEVYKALGVTSKDPVEKRRAMLEALTDARLFGGVFAADKGERESFNVTGPVQFAWGESFHPVERHLTRSITSRLKSKEDDTQGTIGKDWRILYGVIGFYGIISSARARESGLKVQDVANFDEWIWDALLTQATTRSKIGQRPRLYVRVEYEKYPILGDLRDYVDVDMGGPVAEAGKVTLDVSRLATAISDAGDKIRRVHWRMDHSFKTIKGIEGVEKHSKAHKLG